MGHIIGYKTLIISDFRFSKEQLHTIGPSCKIIYIVMNDLIKYLKNISYYIWIWSHYNLKKSSSRVWDARSWKVRSWKISSEIGKIGFHVEHSTFVPTALSNCLSQLHISLELVSVYLVGGKWWRVWRFKMFKMLNIENWVNFEYFGAGKNGSKSKSDSEVFLISKILRDEKNICRFILFLV